MTLDDYNTDVTPDARGDTARNGQYCFGSHPNGPGDPCTDTGSGLTATKSCAGPSLTDQCYPYRRTTGVHLKVLLLLPPTHPHTRHPPPPPSLQPRSPPLS